VENKWQSEPSKGYSDIETEFEASLRRAFVEHHADFIMIDSRRHVFLIESAAYGVERGWLTEKFIELDEQSSQLRYRLTAAGKRHFGLK
jgi:hypothetical protein